MMNKAQETMRGCACCAMNRRQFLASCAACAAGAGGLGLLSPKRAAAADATAGKPRIKLVYLHIPSDRPIWPNIGYDFDKRKKELTQKLTAACPGIELQPATVMNADEAKKLIESDPGVDGYVLYVVGIWTGAAHVLTGTGKPAVLVDDLYAGSGEFLIANAAARRAGQKVVGVSSARFADVADVVRCFEVLKRPGATADDFLAAANAARKKGFARPGDLKCIADKVTASDPSEVLRRLKESTILVVGAWHEQFASSIRDSFGPKVLKIEFAELHNAYEKADRDEAAQWADRWIGAADKMIEPTRDEICRSGAMYLAMKGLLAKHNAQAITINCLGGFYGGHIKAYPCLGFTQLNNDGLIGACEADQISTISMLTMNYLIDRPGYISDPVIDTSTNQIIYAHCVAPTKVFGPKGRSNPYHIRNHSEDRKGAVVRSLLPLGYMTTTLEFHPVHKKVILHQGKAVANIDEDKACRTKLAVEVKGDIDKLMSEWDQWGWHRVTVYGDVKEPVAQMADALKLKVLEEA